MEKPPKKPKKKTVKKSAPKKTPRAAKATAEEKSSKRAPLTDAQRAALDAGRSSWKPGQSGNPAGKPKGSLSRSTLLKKYLDVTFKSDDGKVKNQPFGIEGDPLTVHETIALALIKKAMAGNIDAIREIQDSVYGKKPDVISGDPDAPIKHEHEHTDLKGEALMAELAKRGLPTSIFKK